MKISPIVYAVPFFVFFIILEIIWGLVKKRKVYSFEDTLTNLSLGIGNQLFSVVTKALLFGLASLTQSKIGLFDLHLNVVNVIVCLILFDFLFYWAHRWGHEYSFFWGAHLVHHQSENYNLSVALRQSWFHNLLAFVIFLPIPILGFSAEVFGIAAAINTLFQFLIHTQSIKKFPFWIEFIWNTPSHHRVHHSTNSKYLDKNHGGMFIVWDRLFGTFAEEDFNEEIKYGITTRFNSFNPVLANFHFYKDYLVSIFKSKKRLNILKRMFGGPENIDSIEVSNVNTNVKRSFFYNIYIFSQFVFVFLGSVIYLAYYTELSLVYKFIFFSLIIFNLWVIGGTLENKRFIFIVEYFRLLITAFILNLFYYTFYTHWFIIFLVSSGVITSFSFLYLNILNYFRYLYGVERYRFKV